MDEISRMIGRLEVEFEKSPSIESGLQLAEMYIRSNAGQEAIGKLLDLLLSKFPGDLSVLSFIYTYFTNSDKKDAAEQLFDKIKSIEPSLLVGLRQKLAILAVRNDKETSLKEVEAFEKKLGRMPETCWLLFELYSAMEKPDEAAKMIEECKKLPDSFEKKLALSAMMIGNDDGKLHENWEKSQELIIELIKEKPENQTIYQLFFNATRNLAPNRKTIDTILATALEKNLKDPFIFLNILNIYIEYSIIIRNEKIFDRLKEILPEFEQPVIKMLEVLTLYFDNYGLSRSILGTWYNPTQSMKPEFSVYMSNLASDLANAAFNGLGVKYVSIDSKKPLMSNAELSIYLRNIAIESLQRYINSAPNNPDAHFRLGLLYKELNDNRAYAAFEKALELSPDNINAMYQIAVIKDKADDDIEAYEMFRRITNSKTTDMGMMIDAMIRASEIAIKYGWIEEGEEFLEKANALMPTNPQVVTMLGKVFLKEAKIIGSDFALLKAQENFQKALALDPTNVDAAYYLGQVFYIKREYLAAIRQFSETSNKFKECSMLCSFWTSRSYHQLYKGLLFSSKDFLTSAIKHAESLRTLAEKIPETQEYIAELYNEAGMEEEASKLLEKATKKKIGKDFAPKDGVAGEIKVLAVYAPQVVRPDDPNRVERVFSKGSVGMLEISYIPGNGGLLITGNMGESFQNAIEVAYAFFKRYLMSKNRIQDPNFDIHVDVPGWFPKYDGPSAGVNLAVAMISAYSGKPIPTNVTMTGEISFHGKVMPVGGIKEKIEATYEKGVDKVFIPKENQWDYLDMLIKDTMQEMVSASDKQSFKLPIIIAVKSIEEVVDDLGIGVEVLVEQPEESK